MDSNTLAQTYVQHDGQWFFVSTINRRSSDNEYPRLYAETIVWNFDPFTRERGSIIHQDNDLADSIETHQMIVDELHEYGRIV